jgi:hypothetical protein
MRSGMATPNAGDNAREILQELGYSETGIATDIAKGAVRPSAAGL